jgi:hypothetical protein
MENRDSYYELYAQMIDKSSVGLFAEIIRYD